MQRLQNIKWVKCSSPAAIVNNAAVLQDTIDTKGFDEALFIVQLGATDIALSVCKLAESDASNMGSATDVPNADLSVSPATLPSATADDTAIGIHVKLGGPRKRYMRLSVTVGNGSTGAFTACYVLLSKGEVFPGASTPTDRGFGQMLLA